MQVGGRGVGDGMVLPTLHRNEILRDADLEAQGTSVATNLRRISGAFSHDAVI